MSCPATLVTVPGAAAYDFGEAHPMRPFRVRLTLRLAEQLGILHRNGWRHITSEPAAMSDLLSVHGDTYVTLVRNASRLPDTMRAAAGLGTEDTPVFDGMHEAAAAIAGGTLAACTAVSRGDSLHAANLTGGLHHAMRDHASGFCVYNDPPIGIASLLRAGHRRVAYVDLDAHHGDGVEAAFASDPRVLTISIHQDGRTLFPGTGRPEDIGAVGAEGTAVNIALPPTTDDIGWLRALTAVVPILIHEFAPEVLVTQCGCDGHRRDPLTDLEITTEGFTAAYNLMHQLAHEVCDGRWVVLGGGGYDAGSAVPRSWTQLLAVMSGGHLPATTEVPDTWRDEARRFSTAEPPVRLGDTDAPPVWVPWDAGEGDPDDPLDRSIAATRRAVLPLHGLDPVVDR